MIIIQIKSEESLLQLFIFTKSKLLPQPERPSVIRPHYHSDCVCSYYLLVSPSTMLASYLFEITTHVSYSEPLLVLSEWKLSLLLLAWLAPSLLLRPILKSHFLILNKNLQSTLPYFLLRPPTFTFIHSTELEYIIFSIYLVSNIPYTPFTYLLILIALHQNIIYTSTGIC